MSPVPVHAVGVTFVFAGALLPGVNGRHDSPVDVTVRVYTHRGVPAFTDCSWISSAYASSGDTDVLTFLAGMTEYVALGFGPAWLGTIGRLSYRWTGSVRLLLGRRTRRLVPADPHDSLTGSVKG
jgi:hypothetical protein